MWIDDLIQGWYGKTNRVDRTRHQGEKHTFDTSTPAVGPYSNVGRKLFFTWILYVTFDILLVFLYQVIMLPVGLVSWSGRPQVKMEANYWIKQGVYCTYVMLDKSRTWFFSVRDCWHDCERQYQSYTFTLDKWLKMSIITYVASSQRSRTRLFCYVKCHIRFWPPWSNNYRSGIIKIYLLLGCLSLNWYISNLYIPPSTYQAVFEQKINVCFLVTYVIYWHPQL